MLYIFEKHNVWILKSHNNRNAKRRWKGNGTHRKRAFSKLLGVNLNPSLNIFQNVWLKRSVLVLFKIKWGGGDFNFLVRKIFEFFTSLVLFVREKKHYKSWKSSLKIFSPNTILSQLSRNTCAKFWKIIFRTHWELNFWKS